MSAQLTSTDLDRWAATRDAQGHLPTLVRKLIMATVQPDSIRMPAAEGVALPGLDGLVAVHARAKPFVPSGKSAWEIGTTGRTRQKATSDYEKRTDQTTKRDRRSTTFVFVTARTWGGGEAWVQDMAARGDGWKRIVALAADELSLWLDQCPGVEAWLTRHMGLPSLGNADLASWFRQWSEQSSPSTPAGVLLAGRRGEAAALVKAFDETPRATPIAAASIDEAVAFIGAVALEGLGKKQSEERPSLVGEGDVSGPKVPGRSASRTQLDEPEPAAEKLEAIRARCVVILDEDGWRRWSAHGRAHILIPLFEPGSVDDALRAGHHVVLPRVARGTADEGLLSPIEPHVATEAWQSEGVDFYRAFEYAKDSRRSLGSLRRRLSRHHRQVPGWAVGPTASLLASALLAGGWQADNSADHEVLQDLTGRDSWRGLARDLTAHTTGVDAPLRASDHTWNFVNIVDAWDCLGSLVTSADIDVWTEHVAVVLSEVDPCARMSAAELRAQVMKVDPVRRHYSGSLRRGLATSLAVLGAVRSDEPAAGARTGQNVATSIVRGLLAEADEDRWLALVDVFGLLAEAAPDAFLQGLENALAQPSPHVSVLFAQWDTVMGDKRPRHSSLLWALEALAFSPDHVARVAVVLARLCALDSGERQGNRAMDSLLAILDLHRPQSGVDSSSRDDIIDAVSDAVPVIKTELLVGLGRRRGAGLVRPGPRFRNWSRTREQSTHAQAAESVSALCMRLTQDPDTDWTLGATLLGSVGTADRDLLLSALEDRWDALDAAEQQEILKEVESLWERSERRAQSRGSMPSGDRDPRGQQDRLGAFVRARSEVGPHDGLAALFGWLSEAEEIRTDAGNTVALEPLEKRRRDAVAHLISEADDPLPAVLDLTTRVDMPVLVGRALAECTVVFDAEILDRLRDQIGTEPADLACIALGQGMVSVRVATPQWLTDTVVERPDQAARLLLACETSAAVLDLVDGADDEQRSLYWSRVSPYRMDENVIERVCEGLLAHDRPYSAMTALSVRDVEVPIELVLRALRTPLRGTAEGIDHPEYSIGLLLNRLESLEVPDAELAAIEMAYVPWLHLHRPTSATHRELARDPELFADLVSCMYPRRDDSMSDIDGDDAVEETIPPLTEVERQVAEMSYVVLGDWESPLPGAVFETPSDTEAMQAWVDGARSALAARGRAHVASDAIGHALAGTRTDDDGTWPCRAVRDVLQQEADDDLESALIVTRQNQLGVTVRGGFDGGALERELAAEYRRWGDAVRNRWTRAGKMLDALAIGYESQGRREDRSAERRGQ